ncbi:hypothetical protein SAMN04487967_2043 [Natronorubrum sediminis]|uniref:Uncharacterized protein n=1 Tax=Natronorubrum sediminis TaxID=640943 RepID=A0A1H6FYT8_9EURY|nr:hypothetical protein [Natronorubrum sediminis]SEH15368.1 hypothetical protein SAMN04487967_2043 [Natronorubrum sediminis]
MSHSSASRGQTEPIAALFAVMALIAGVGLYTVYVSDVLPGTSDRTVTDTAIDNVWDDLEDAERGTFPAYEYESEMDQEMLEAIQSNSLPNGENVYIEVRAYDDGESTVFAAAHFDSDGDDLRDRQLQSTHSDFGPPRAAGEPDETDISTRPISIEVTEADVRGGTVHVEAW